MSTKPPNPYSAIDALANGTKADDIDVSHLDFQESMRWMHTVFGAGFAFRISGKIDIATEADKLVDKFAG